MTVSISPMERIAADLATYSAIADTLGWSAPSSLPATIVQGDQLLVLTGRVTAGGGMTPPTGWTSLVSEVAGAYTWELFGKIADEEDVAGSAVWTDVTADAVGLLAVYRGGVVGSPMVAHIDPFAAIETASDTSHPAPAITDTTTQTTDVVLSLLWLVSSSVTVTVPALPDGAELIATGDATEGRRRGFEHADGMIGSTGGGFTVETSAACVSTGAAVALRARRLRTPVGLSDSIPGHVGLARTGGPVPDDQLEVG